MRMLALSLGLLAATTVIAAADSTLNYKIQMATSDMNNAENVAKIKKTFDMAAAQRGRQAIEISCSPASSNWCTDGFVTACNNADGGLSSVDDGSKSGIVTCSLPQHK